MTTESQSKALETAPTQNYHAGRGCKPWAAGRGNPIGMHCILSAIQLHSWHPCVLLSVHSVRAVLMFMECQLWFESRKKPVCLGLNFDVIERQGKTISLHLCKDLFHLAKSNGFMNLGRAPAWGIYRWRYSLLCKWEVYMCGHTVATYAGGITT